MSSGSSIIASISSNLSNTYSYLASLYPEDGVTYKNITAARNDNTNYLTLNQPFATYLQNNFQTLDKDGDGVISADEMNNLTNTISTSSFTHSCNKQEKLDEENYRKATQTSVFYGDDNASTDVSSYSILSYKYKNFNSK